MARGGGLLAQGSIGTKGNFEVVVPRVGGGFLHLWRNNDAAPFPWSVPDLAMGSEGDVTNVVLIADNLKPGELASIRREGSRLECSVRGSVNVHGAVRYRWGGSVQLPGGAVAAGAPGSVQSVGMHHPRVLCDGVLLPDGSVLVVGGSSTGKSDVGVDPVLPAEVYDPSNNSWTELAPINCPHMYHSTAVLLPDGRVMRGGKDGQFQRDPYKYFEHRLELFSPPYLFAGPRPEISSAPAAGSYGQDITINSPTAGDIARVALIRLGAVTHSFHMDQRYVGLTITAANPTQLSATLPPNGQVAPPGAYMLFLVNTAGIPSVASIIAIG